MRHAIVLSILAALAIPAATAGAATKAVVTIDAAPHTIVYGASTGLTGNVSPGKRDIQVSVLSQSCATGALPALAPSQVTDTVSTDASGAWATPDTPATTTAYAARAEGSTSSTIRVAVKPRVTLKRIAHHRYSATVLAAQSFAGRKASFQRFRPSRHSWKTVRRVKLKEIATTEAAPTMASGATFRSGVRARNRVRLVLSQSQVGACYLAGRSAVIRS